MSKLTDEQLQEINDCVEKYRKSKTVSCDCKIVSPLECIEDLLGRIQSQDAEIKELREFLNESAHLLCQEIGANQPTRNAAYEAIAKLHEANKENQVLKAKLADVEKVKKVYCVTMSYHDGDHEHGTYRSPLFLSKEDAEAFRAAMIEGGSGIEWWSDGGWNNINGDQSVIEEIEVFDRFDGQIKERTEYLEISWT
jgi:hypothetical protein